MPVALAGHCLAASGVPSMLTIGRVPSPLDVAGHGAVVVECGLLDDDYLAVDVGGRYRRDDCGHDVRRTGLGADHDGRRGTYPMLTELAPPVSGSEVLSSAVLSQSLARSSRHWACRSEQR